MMNFEYRRKPCIGKPSPERYRMLLEHYAQRRLIPIQRVLSRDRTTQVALVRWEAWRELKRQGFSYPGIGLTARRHHTTILAGIRRLPDVEAGIRWCRRAQKSKVIHRDVNALALVGE